MIYEWGGKMKQSKVCNIWELDTLYVMEMELLTHVDIYHNYVLQCILCIMIIQKYFFIWEYIMIDLRFFY